MSETYRNLKLSSESVTKDTVLLVEAINRQGFVSRDELRAINKELVNLAATTLEIGAAINEFSNSLAYSMQAIHKTMMEKST